MCFDFVDLLIMISNDSEISFLEREDICRELEDCIVVKIYLFNYKILEHTLSHETMIMNHRVSYYIILYGLGVSVGSPSCPR